MNILLLEDEQRAGEKLKRLVQEKLPNASVQWKRSVVEGTSILKEQPFDLIFSDIELLDGHVFEIYTKVEPNCPIIFCTAFNTFYVEAFKTNGIAYLLKPYTELELNEAVDKYLKLYWQEETPVLTASLLAQLRAAVGAQQATYRSHFPVRKGKNTVLLKTAEISYLQARGDFAVAVDKQGRQHSLSLSLGAALRELSPDQFLQINRSEIINLKEVKQYEPYIKNRIAIHLQGIAEAFYTSNSKSATFRAWAES
jgi:DNA-binding LytR/AlgR family response regulator